MLTLRHQLARGYTLHMITQSVFISILHAVSNRDREAETIHLILFRIKRPIPGITDTSTLHTFWQVRTGSVVSWRRYYSVVPAGVITDCLHFDDINQPHTPRHHKTIKFCLFDLVSPLMPELWLTATSAVLAGILRRRNLRNFINLRNLSF